MIVFLYKIAHIYINIYIYIIHYRTSLPSFKTSTRLHVTSIWAPFGFHLSSIWVPFELHLSSIGLNWAPIRAPFELHRALFGLHLSSILADHHWLITTDWSSLSDHHWLILTDWPSLSDRHWLILPDGSSLTDPLYIYIYKYIYIYVSNHMFLGNSRQKCQFWGVLAKVMYFLANIQKNWTVQCSAFLYI